MSPPVWGPFPAEWGEPPDIAWGTFAEPWGIDNRSQWIDACERADQARGVVRGPEAQAAVAARAAPPARREGMSGWQARAELEARRAQPEGGPERRSLRTSPRGRTFNGDEAVEYLIARDFAPITRPRAVGEAIAYRYAGGFSRRRGGRHAN